VWRPGRDLNPGLAGDSRLYYSGIEEDSLHVTGLYYQGCVAQSANFHNENWFYLSFSFRTGEAFVNDRYRKP